SCLCAAAEAERGKPRCRCATRARYVAGGQASWSGSEVGAVLGRRRTHDPVDVVHVPLTQLLSCLTVLPGRRCVSTRCVSSPAPSGESFPSPPSQRASPARREHHPTRT